jgi:WD40 repeat protein
VETETELFPLKGRLGFVHSVLFGPDGSRIMIASHDATARLWDAATGEVSAVLKGHMGVVRSASFSPDGLRVVTASHDTTVRVWDVATGTEVALLNGHEAAVHSASFSPDGRRVVTASDDKTVRVWDVSRTEAVVRERTIVLAAALARGVGRRTDCERADLLMQDAEDDLYREALKQIGRTSDDPEIAKVAAALAAPLDPNCYLSPTQFAEKFAPPARHPEP